MAKGTRTRDFGASNRENHDSSYFYQSKLYQDKVTGNNPDGIENPFPKTLENKIVLGDSRDLSILPDSSLHLVITSPPYSVKKQYENDLTLDEYLSLIRDVFQAMHSKLIDGGRICFNIANIGRKPYIPLSDYISNILTGIGYHQRGEIIWNKAATAGTSTAWGSWKSSSNPVLRDVHEYLLVFSKGTMKRKRGIKLDTISKDEFLEFTKSVWAFPTESAKKIGHPAPFPVELPYRCIQLYSFQDDVIFDPFMGSGTTGIAALMSKRRYFGIDTKEEYVRLANDRIEKWYDSKDE
ncbi:MAG: DNA-methyltransferase [Candidatus Kariarchaeaceae archaeon]